MDIKTILPFLLAFLFLPRPALGAAPGTAAHRLRAEISPAAGTISVTDEVSFDSPRTEYIFTLHEGLNPSAEGAAIEELPADTAQRYGINSSSAAGIYAAYRLVTPKPSRGFTLKYGGVISHPPGEQAQEYSRSFSETPGTISADGCYLSGASGWYPHFEGSLVTFRLETDLPPPYDTVAGGDRTGRKTPRGRIVSTWETAKPQDEITLTCGKYSEYSRKDGPLTYYVFLLSPDGALAEKYLEATGKYVGFYSGLIGAYPYGKFALVENFWDTGYGMPSFTLLGPKVIRLPFILNSSYPHEILHNWWGNGVFVDYEKGNWCEGLTAYLADYLIAEDRGKGREYRMTTLQKYSDYVSAGKDFPLVEFRSRDSSASEAVGYGKSMMVYHMLRNMLGTEPGAETRQDRDENFRKGLRGFYADNAFKYAAFGDLREAFEAITGPGRLKPFFDQWTLRAGAPALALKNARVTRGTLEGYELEFTIAQTQDGPAYSLQVPTAIYLEGTGSPRMKTLPMTSKEATFHYTSPLLPVRLEIDPEFDIFRTLSPLETPPTLSRVLGAAKPAIILPEGPAGDPWRVLALAWTKDKNNLPEISDDAARSSAPASGSYWIFGGENRLAGDFENGLGIYGARFTPDTVTIDNRRFPRAGHTFVFAAFSPSDPAFSGALVVSGSPDKLPLLASKLPHYGKYSWLVFDGGMNSLASGVWTASRSPLGTDLAGTPPGARAYPARPPLAQLPSVFSGERMSEEIRGLAALPGGRGPASPGLRRAAETIRKAFSAAGLKPFSGAPVAPGARQPADGNLLYVAEGTKKPGEYVALCAHYDHLAQKGGEVFSGADDNASGVALLLELARHYARNPGERSIIFAAFDGEEQGRLGSSGFLSALQPGVKAKVNAALNFDTVGRLDGGKILVLGSGSSDKWTHIFRGAGFVTGSDYELVKEDLDASDQQSFIEAGIPAVQFFSGPKPEYHKASDTADKIDAAGLVKEAEFAREIVDYLAGGSDFITRPGGSAPPLIPSQQAPRRASTGLVPDFAFQGQGVRALEITPGSPLAAAGVKPGDVIIKLDGTPTGGLRAYAAELKKFSPGRKISVTYLSDGAEKTVQVELGAK